MARVFLMSDLHLSPTHGFFWQNWTVARDAANAAGADLVIVNGDLCIDGPDSDAEMAFAGQALGVLRGKVLALPGNHDVGDEPPGQDARQIIDATRLARWNAVFGSDRFAVDFGVWRCIGLNSLLLGSGLAEEADQEAWLTRELATAMRPVALFLHKPLFLLDPGETEIGPITVNPEPRARLMALLAGSQMRLVVSGHLHAHRDTIIAGIRYLWLPALAFVHGTGLAGATPMIAATTLDLTEATPAVTLLHLPGLVAHDLDAIKEHGRWAFLRNMPACPPEV